MIISRRDCLTLPFAALPSAPFAMRVSAQRAIVSSGFIVDAPPTPQSHAATLAETADGRLVAAWFGGTAERAPDVCIWMASCHTPKLGRWSRPRIVAEGLSLGGKREPTWNPVLFQPAHGAPLMLFHKVGADPQHWRGLLAKSADGGRHWTRPLALPSGFTGPARSKPVQLRGGGRIICGASTEAPIAPGPTVTAAEAGAWQVHFEWSDDLGRHWQRTPPLTTKGAAIDAIQPSLAMQPDGRIVALARTRQGRVAFTQSGDQGRSWEPLELLEDLPNPNAGIELLSLADGRTLLIHNPREPGARWQDGRDRLDVSCSEDGRRWRHVLTLEDEAGEEFSYPAAIQANDGLVHVAYTWKRRRVRYVVLDPGRLG